MLSGMKQTSDDPFLRFLGLTAGDSPHGDLIAEFIETVLGARGQWDAVVQKHLD